MKDFLIRYDIWVKVLSMLSFFIAIINLLWSSKTENDIPKIKKKSKKIWNKKIKIYIGLAFAVIAFILLLIIMLTHYPLMPEPSIKTLSKKYLQKENNACVYQFEVYYEYYGTKPVSLIFATQPKGQPYVALQMKDWPPTDLRSLQVREKARTVTSGPIYIGDAKNYSEQTEHYFYPILIESSVVKNLFNRVPRPNQICVLDSLSDIYNYVGNNDMVILPRVGYLVDFKKDCR